MRHDQNIRRCEPQFDDRRISGMATYHPANDPASFTARGADHHHFYFARPSFETKHLPPLGHSDPYLADSIPFELGLICYLGYRRMEDLTEGIVLNREPLPRKDYFIFTPALLFWSVLIFMSLVGLIRLALNSL